MLGVASTCDAERDRPARPAGGLARSAAPPDAPSTDSRIQTLPIRLLGDAVLRRVEGIVSTATIEGCERPTLPWRLDCGRGCGRSVVTAFRRSARKLALERAGWPRRGPPNRPIGDRSVFSMNGPGRGSSPKARAGALCVESRSEPGPGERPAQIRGASGRDLAQRSLRLRRPRAPEGVTA